MSCVVSPIISVSCGGKADPIHQPLEHVRMRLGQAFVGAARRREELAEPLLRERAVETRARLARRDGEQEAGPRKLGEQFARARVELDLRIACNEMVAVARGKIRVAVGREPGRDMLQRIGKAETDHVPRIEVGRHRLSQIPARLLQRVRDDRRRVDQRPVPVEDDEREAARSELSRRQHPEDPRALCSGARRTRRDPERAALR